jgi:tight adherence protein C
VSAAQLLAFLSAAFGAAGLSLLVPARHAGRLPSGPGARALRLLALAGSRLGRGRASGAPADLSVRVAAAGAPAGLGTREVMAAKLAAALAGGGIGVLLSALAPGRLGLLLSVGAPLGGFLAPDLWLARRAAARARRVRRELPVLLDLLRVTIEAGGSLPAALRTVGERTQGPLAAEWRAVGREVALGVTLEEALGGMTTRLPQPEVQALVAALERSRRHGAPLAETLAAQARDARLTLQRRVREEAAKAGPKIQLVVALLLVPSVLLLVAAALAAALLGSGGELVPA